MFVFVFACVCAGSSSGSRSGSAAGAKYKRCHWCKQTAAIVEIDERMK